MSVVDDTPEAIENKIDENCSRLIESYRTLLRRSQFNYDKSIQRYEELQMQTSAENIVHYSMNILQQIQDIRIRAIVDDKEGIDRNRDAQRAILERTARELDTLDIVA